MSVHRFTAPDAVSAAEAASHHIVMLLQQARAGRESATLAVSGGSTPHLLFERLAASNLDWDAIHLFWVDERCVPPTDTASNFKLADETLIRPARIPYRNVHRIHGEVRPEAAATRYTQEIIDFFEGAPHFDVVHLGMGPDAHTASLFPCDPLIEDRQNIAAATYVGKFAQWRVTLLPAVLLAARHSVFLVAGADKNDAVRAVFREEYDPMRYPAQIVAHHGRAVTWFLDVGASALLD